MVGWEECVLRRGCELSLLRDDNCRGLLVVRLLRLICGPVNVSVP
jgi:hypothetical protein